jgi:integrase
MARKRKPTRRKPGTGYTTQAKNGAWSALFPKFGGGYHVRKGFNTRSAAEAWLDSLAEQRKGKGDIEGGQQKTRAWIHTWAQRAAREREWKAKMVADVEWKLGYVNPYIGDAALVDLLPDHIDAIWDDLTTALAETTVRQIRNYLWQVFEEARERRYITFNPVLKPKRHKRARQKEPQRLSAPLAALLLTNANDSFYVLAYWFILCLGLRAGEVCGLRRTDIDLRAATLTISQEYTHLRGRPHKDMPKGDKIRIIPFPRPLVPLIEAHFKTLTGRAAQGLVRGTWEENTLVFPGRSGKPMSTTSLRHNLKNLTDACRLPPVTTHMLRHAAGGLFTSVGTPENVTAGILGHAANTITRHYAPPDVETMRLWVEKVYQVLAGEAEKTRKKSLGM